MTKRKYPCLYSKDDFVKVIPTTEQMGIYFALRHLLTPGSGASFVAKNHFATKCLFILYLIVIIGADSLAFWTFCCIIKNFRI